MPLNYMSSSAIRQSFLDFFGSKDHLFVRSSPVAPKDDPTLLFINAGMNQFKSIFLGDTSKGYKRVANSQKCIRVSGKHNDLDEVGKDTYHHTLFEMLGNWSFGDYYKAEAIGFAWELLTEVWKLSKDRIFVTVYKDDDEAAELWTKITGIDPSRIMRFGEKENFWEMGETGPCGPCSEIHYDMGDISDQHKVFNDPILGVNGENARFIEIWNLVFIQYERISSGELVPLKDKHVDTGMGFERICAILQNVKSNYDTDLFRPILQKIESLSGVPYQDGPEGMPHRVIADHLRTLSFGVADGVLPSNEGRGYVLRRILRRASRYAKKLGQDEAFICKLVPTLVEIMGEAFPEIREQADFASQVIRSEEERFIKTLGTGLERFEKFVAELQGQKIISGAHVFLLYDTYGFPPDLTRVLAEERGLSIDEKGFETAMASQKQRARDARKDNDQGVASDEWIILREESGTQFTGYEFNESLFHITRYYIAQSGEILIHGDQTPFYAESGGQVGESGLLKSANLSLQVTDTLKINDAWVHKAICIQGTPTPQTMQEEFQAIPDPHLRNDTRRNHSATHLMHAALRSVLGEHVTQQGSRVSADSLRFDFSHFQGMTPAELEKVESLVNEKIMENLAVNCVLEDLETAQKSGAMALFGEKYEDNVRVISMGGFSKELCGGLHVKATGEIGSFKILSEASTAAGIRRIEAVTGRGALGLLRQKTQNLNDLTHLIKCKPEQLSDRIAGLLESNRAFEKEIEALRQAMAVAKVNEAISQSQTILGVPVCIQSLGEMDPGAFKAFLDGVQNAAFKGIAVFSSEFQGSGSLAVIVSKEQVSVIKAGELVGLIAETAGGKGGGRPDRAQAGTKFPEKLVLALDQAKVIIQERLS
jgi:alanyl-tRNA synthetase